MKLMSSARTRPAAMIRSPSFSRSSSSSITTMRPARSSSRMSGMESKDMGCVSGVELTQPFEITRHHIGFQVDPVAGLALREGRRLDRMRNQVDGKARALDGIDREADAVHADRTLGSDVARQFRGRLDRPALRTRVRLDGDDAACAIHVAGHQMASEAIRKPQ